MVHTDQISSPEFIQGTQDKAGVTQGGGTGLFIQESFFLPNFMDLNTGLPMGSS